MELLRRVLQRPVTVAAFLEFAMWLGVAYVVVGVAWAFVHADRVSELEAAWAKAVPVGANIAAFGEATALWPAILLLPTTCSVGG
ncbi:hypothetical protein OQ968_22855 [Mycobacterium sp. 663a-19]|uniref:hypothetical protein n=1 Tax=Mycobacterium sp. 663a-19 TaxID=2986148 RepID=UPI002D1F2A5E|nr:hypothetical protein [Mycobacterium sp. 663a-19]MEB3984093.1 hypothetical protein [Mycobacterium sp. 663a-19]